jgi:chromatin assembly factor 1 subunit A
MAKFFGKAKGGIARAPYKGADSAEAGPSSSQSDFERTFKPFVLKKDADLAPVNWFLEENHRRRTRGKWFRPERDVIVIDDDEVVGGADVQRQNGQEMDADIIQLSAKGTCFKFRFSS